MDEIERRLASDLQPLQGGAFAEHFERAMAACFDGRFAAMKEHLEAALRECGDDAAALVMLGAAYTQLRRFDEAEPILTRAVSLRPNLAAAHQALGTMWLESNRYEEAAREYERAV